MVLIDDIPTASILNWDETHTFINFTYSEEFTHNVKVIGETVTDGLPPIKEFPDLDGNGKIDIRDIALVAKHYGEER